MPFPYDSPVLRRRLIALALLASLAHLSGCLQSAQRSTPQQSLQALGPDGKPAMTQQELGALVRAFADKYVEVTSQAFDEMQAKGMAPEARAAAHGRRAFGAASAYSIAAQPNPEVGLLDMVVQVTLEREIWTRGEAELVFAGNAPILMNAYDRLDADAWALAGRIFTEEQLDTLRDAVENWLIANPQQRYLAFVQVDEFARLRDQSALGSVGKTGGLSMLAPINDATRAAEEIRLLGERALYIVQRMPRLARMQVDLFTAGLLLQPETERLLHATDTIPPALESLSKSLGELPDQVRAERAEIVRSVEEAIARQRDEALRALDERAATLGTLIADGRTLVKEAGPLADSVRETAAAADRAVATVDGLLQRIEARPKGADGAAPESHVEALADAAEKLANATRDLDRALANADTLLRSPEWSARISDVSGAAATRINHAGLWGLALIGAFFAGLIAYRRLAPRARA